MSVTADITVNAKETVSSGKNSTTTQYINKNGISYDKNYGSWGYDISGPTSADIYLSATLGKTTFKYMYGVDGDYFYRGIDLEYNINKDISIEENVRMNTHQTLVKAMSYVIWGITLYELIPSPATAIAALYKYISGFKGTSPTLSFS